MKTFRERLLYMKTFNLYRHPTQGFEAVKVGFSWPAFFFTILWMLVKRLWGLAALWFVANVVCCSVGKVTDQAQASGTQALVYLALTAAYFVLGLVPALSVAFSPARGLMSLWHTGNRWQYSGTMGQPFPALRCGEVRRAGTILRLEQRATRQHSDSHDRHRHCRDTA